MPKGLTRYLRVILDRREMRRTVNDLIDSLDKAGNNSGAAFLTSLRERFNRDMAELREKLARGIINEKEFKKQGDKAAKAFNAGLLHIMDEARKKGEITDREYIKLTKTLKKVGDEGAKSAGLLHTGFAKVIGLIASFVALRRLTRWTADVVSLGVAGAETASKYQTTFGAATKIVDRFGDTFGKLAGLSRNEIREATATVGAMARGMGYAENAAADLATQVVTVAGDLTSFNNVPLEDTLRAVRSAITGERESLKTLGIVILETDVQQRALVMTGKENVKTLNQQEKAAATLALIMERMGPAAGDLVRTQDSMANVGRRVAAAWRTFKENLGEALISAQTGPSTLATLAGMFEQLNGWVVTNKTNIAEFSSIVLTLVETLTKLTAILAKPLVFTYRIVVDRESLAERLDLRGRRKPIKGLKSPDTQKFVEGEIAAGGLRSVLTGERVNPFVPPDKPHVKTPEELAAEARARQEAAKKADAALTKEITELKRGHELRLLTTKEIARAIELERRLTAQANDTNLSLERRVAAQERAESLADVARLPLDRSLRTGAAEGLSAEGLITRDIGIIADPGAQAKVAEEFANPWLEALSRIEAEVETQGGLFAQLGDAWATGGIAGLAKLAKAKVLENLARAIEEGAKAFGALALGNAGSATFHAKSAAEHVLAAARWKLAGAGLAAALGGGGGGGAGDLGGSGNIGGASADKAQITSETHIYLNPFDRDNPVMQSQVGSAVEKYAERGGRIVLHNMYDNSTREIT